LILLLLSAENMTLICGARGSGAIILGIGGDNSPWAAGTFYEGAMTYGFATDETEQAVFANIAAAGYGK
jgi:non-reducing end alpha-L-arabinofuranosidase